MEIETGKFKHVSYLWDEKEVAKFDDESSSEKEIDLLLYRSNKLGADLRLTNYGGGNTSCKVTEKDPLTGKDTEVMYVKGSGGDIGTLKRNGLAGLYLNKLQDLKKVYRGIEYEDEMVGLFNHCIFDLDSKAPSIDTPLHAFLPFKHIDHLHPDAAIAIAACKDGKKINEELFDGKMGWVDWQRPGFDLGLQLENCLKENPDIRGIMLGGHGLFTWGDTAYESYVNSLEVIERYSEYLEEGFSKQSKVFGGVKTEALSKNDRLEQAAKLAPVLRGYCSNERQMVGHFTDDDRVLEFINSQEVERLAKMGTSCPDHFLRTKICPLVLELNPDFDLDDVDQLRSKLEPAFEDYRAYYKKYYEEHKHSNSPAMRDPNPVVILYPGVGMFTFAKNKQTARVASEFYINAINVMRGAEAVSEYVSLPLQEAFDIEYWLLEEAKLQRMPKPKPLSGKTALVTGSGGGIGKAIAQKFLEEGACVMITDINDERSQATVEEFQKDYSKDNVDAIHLDVTKESDIEEGLQATCLSFGGIDIVVNNAGLSLSKALNETTLKDWKIVQNILVEGQFLVSKSAAAILQKQEIGGDIVNIVSKNALVSGPNNVAYGTAKAAQLHMSHLLAAELGKDRIRVNVVNPDAVIQGSNIWSGGWAEGRAKAYGISVEELPDHYANRTILKESILPEDIAEAAFTFVSGQLSKSTGNVLNVDGGVAAAFVR